MSEKLQETMWGEVVMEEETGTLMFKLIELGNRDGHHYEMELYLAADTFPVGTKLVISEPVPE